CGQGAHLPYTF
nr:immunoglobulin light chain junction region [Macaca mulatta]MOW64958.1 immunoglobulin light chain junction region [Macaca mulatta]MOW72862.1 immunoglobulin light chain junction region [Macaca mulatta]MOW72928.1 immunoglobulin light chain junction region [Macaca mulatta]MOW72957.1 immunoglobulin light chain junction region [Macaca mulatta]